MNWLKARFGYLSRTTRRTTRRSRAIRPGLQSLEGRQVPSVTLHNGPVIPHVQVESVYWGQSWSQPANQNIRTKLDGFLQTVVHSSYMSMLGEYGVGKGSFGKSDLVSGGGSPADDKKPVTNPEIQNMLISEIQSGNLPQSN